MPSDDELRFPTPSIDPIPVDGDTSCGNSADPLFMTVCGKPGAWHVLWKKDDGGTLEGSFSCLDHMGVIQEKLVYLARHEVSPDCNMPGALYNHTTNRCMVVIVKEDGDEQA